MGPTPRLTDYKLDQLFDRCSTKHSKLAFEYESNWDVGKYFVFDKETKLLVSEQNIYSNPPEFVLGCWIPGIATGGEVLSTTGQVYWDHVLTVASKDEKRTLVGHNICFDLNPLEWDHIPLIWDTALAHYMMMGQACGFPSLEDVAKYYGLGTKENTVSEMIKNGICPSVIPHEQLKEYCAQDVKLTLEVYNSQMRTLCAMKDRRLLVLISQMMEWLWWTHTSSMTGIVVDRNELRKIVPKLQLDLVGILTKVIYYMESRLAAASTFYPDWEPKAELSVTSPKQIYTMIFGGEVDGFLLRNTGGVYKSGIKKGQPVLKKEPIPIHLSGIPGTHRFRAGTDEKNLLAILGSVPMSSEDTEYIQNVLKYRDISKTLNTYLESYLEKSAITGMIHPQYKHVGTPTGRLSCTNPNIQNLKGE